MSAEDTKPKTTEESTTSIPKPPTANVFSMFGAKKEKKEEPKRRRKKDTKEEESKKTDDNEVAEEEEADVEFTPVIQLDKKSMLKPTKKMKKFYTKLEPNYLDSMPTLKNGKKEVLVMLNS